MFTFYRICFTILSFSLCLRIHTYIYTYIHTYIHVFTIESMWKIWKKNVSCCRKKINIFFKNSINKYDFKLDPALACCLLEQKVPAALPHKRLPWMAVGRKVWDVTGWGIMIRAVAGAGLRTSHHWGSERGSLLLATFSVQISRIYDEFHCLPFCSTILGMWLTSGYIHEKLWISGHAASYISRNIIFKKMLK